MRALDVARSISPPAEGGRGGDQTRRGATALDREDSVRLTPAERPPLQDGGLRRGDSGPSRNASRACRSSAPTRGKAGFIRRSL